MPSPLAGLKQMNSQNSENMTAISDKSKMLDAYKASISGPTSTSTKGPSVTQDVDKINPKARYGSGKGEQRIDTTDMTKKLLGSYKKGGKVTKTGIFKLHGTKARPEQVLNAKTTAKVKAKGGMAAVLAGKK